MVSEHVEAEKETQRHLQENMWRFTSGTGTPKLLARIASVERCSVMCG